MSTISVDILGNFTILESGSIVHTGWLVVAPRVALSEALGQLGQDGPASG